MYIHLGTNGEGHCSLVKSVKTGRLQLAARQAQTTEGKEGFYCGKLRKDRWMDNWRAYHIRSDVTPMPFFRH